jgi:GNAT superfamily N-acetyltransferase
MSGYPLRQWTKRQKLPDDTEEHEFLCSTDPALIPIAAVNDAFAQDYVYWAKPLPEEDMRRMINASLCFGLYAHDNITGSMTPSKLIGLARLVTDNITFAYLTDVYVLPEYQGRGLGTWMLRCMDEVVLAWPNLRRIVLFTASGQSKTYYEKLLGAETLADAKGLFILERRGAGNCI